MIYPIALCVIAGLSTGLGGLAVVLAGGADDSRISFSQGFAAGVMVTVLMGSWLSGEQQELAQAMIRLHVVANSDSAEDQALKLAVRDRVLEQTAALWPEGADPETAQAVLQEHLAAIAAQIFGGFDQTAVHFGQDRVDGKHHEGQIVVHHAQDHR